MYSKPHLDHSTFNWKSKVIALYKPNYYIQAHALSSSLNFKHIVG